MASAGSRRFELRVYLYSLSPCLGRYPFYLTCYVLQKLQDFDYSNANTLFCQPDDPEVGTASLASATALTNCNPIGYPTLFVNEDLLVANYHKL